MEKDWEAPRRTDGQMDKAHGRPHGPTVRGTKTRAETERRERERDNEGEEPREQERERE